MRGILAFWTACILTLQLAFAPPTPPIPLVDALRVGQPVQSGSEEKILTSLRSKEGPRLPVAYPDRWEMIRDVTIQQAINELPDNLNEATLAEVVMALSGLIKDFDAEFTAEHVFRTGEYAKGVLDELRKLRYPVKRQKDRAVLYAGVILHDLGKVGVLKEILYKKEKLTEEDWVQIRLHADFGADILMGLRERLPGKEGEIGRTLQQVAQIVRYHHERWDGKGYPAGLQGSAIPLGARIVAAVDAYDSIREDRPYRPGRSHEEAVAILIEEKGKQFDPHIVDLLVRVLSRKHDYTYAEEKGTSAGAEEVPSVSVERGIANVRGIPSPIQFLTFSTERMKPAKVPAGLEVYFEPGLLAAGLEQAVRAKLGGQPLTRPDLERLKMQLFEPGSRRVRILLLVNPDTAADLDASFPWQTPVAIISIVPGAIEPTVSPAFFLSYLLQILQRADALGVRVMVRLEAAAGLEQKRAFFLDVAA